MTTISERHQVTGGKGFIIKFMFDESKPAGTIGSNWSEMYYDGQPDSWTPEIGAHWHEFHDEYMTVIEGRVSFTMNGKEVIQRPGDELLKIPRLAVHSFKFFKGEPTVLREHTDPVGVFKQEFFEDLFTTGSITELSFLQVMRAFGDGDTYVALPGNIKILDKLFTWTVSGIARWFVTKKTVKIDDNGRPIQGSQDK